MEYYMTLRHEYTMGFKEGYEEGYKEGYEEGLFIARLKKIKNLVSNPTLHCTLEDAMDIFEIPQEDRDKYIKALKEEKI